MTAQTPTNAEMEKWLRVRVQFFPYFWLRVRIRCQAKFLASAKFLTCCCFSVILLLRIKK